MRRRLADLDGRVLAGAVVAVFFLVFTSFSYVHGSAPWRSIGVDARKTKFEDLQSVTSSWDCTRRGIQPFPGNPCDPYGRPANYPRMWTHFGVFGLGLGDTVPLGIALGVIFYLAALLVPGRLSAREGVLYAALLLAPATLLGVERGNVDLLMFALVALGVGVVRRSSWAGAAPIVLAAVLKLFPAFGLALLVRRRKRWAALAVSVIVLGLYALATLDDIRTLRHAIPRVIQNSYGAGVVSQALEKAGVSWAQTAAESRDIRLGVIVLGGLAAAGLVALARGREAHVARELRLDAFWAGASIYAGTYVFGNNFDYRLVFLILCVPQLCTWAREGGSPALWPTAAIVAIVATFWLSSAFPPLPFGLRGWYRGLSFPPEEVLNWAIFAWVVAALGSGVLALARHRGRDPVAQLGQ